MIVTWDNVSDLNNEIKKENLNYQVHLSDACRGQCMWIEDMKHDDFIDNIKLQDVIRNYFKTKKSEVVFCENKKSFWIKN